jgi:hypothetical protein
MVKGDQEGGPREADISEITLKRAKVALRVRSIREADGWYWQLPEGKGIKGGQAPKDDPLDPLEPLPANEPLAEGQEDQGDQVAQGDQVRGDERLVLNGNGHLANGSCRHNVPGWCWLSKKKFGEDKRARSQIMTLGKEGE